MSADYFADFQTVRYEGPESANDLAYRWYDKDRVVMGKRMEDHLRFAVCYWHSFCWDGRDPFGGDTFERPWHHMSDPMAATAPQEIALSVLAAVVAAETDQARCHDLLQAVQYVTGRSGRAFHNPAPSTGNLGKRYPR